MSAEFEALKRAYLDGESINSLRKKIGWSYDRIRAELARMGVRLRDQDQALELAKQNRRREAARMAQAGSEAVKRAYLAGETIASISQQTGWAQNRVRRVLRSGGVRIRRGEAAKRTYPADWRPSS